MAGRRTKILFGIDSPAGQSRDVALPGGIHHCPDSTAVRGLRQDLQGQGHRSAALARHQPFHNAPRSDTKLLRAGDWSVGLSRVPTILEREEAQIRAKLVDTVSHPHGAADPGALTCASPDNGEVLD